MLNRRAQLLFAEYADCHRHPMNRLTHKIAIPLIVFHVMAMLDWVVIARLPGPHGGAITAAHLALLFVSGFYGWLTPRLAPIMIALFALTIPLGWITPRPVVVAIAVGGWIIQLAGHQVWEKRSPAFLRNVLQMLVGPVFFVAVVTGEWPARSPKFDRRTLRSLGPSPSDPPTAH